MATNRLRTHSTPLETRKGKVPRDDPPISGRPSGASELERGREGLDGRADLLHLPEVVGNSSGLLLPPGEGGTDSSVGCLDCLRELAVEIGRKAAEGGVQILGGAPAQILDVALDQGHGLVEQAPPPTLHPS